MDIFLEVGQKKINHACESEKEIYFIDHRRERLLLLAGALVTTGQAAETMEWNCPWKVSQPACQV